VQGVTQAQTSRANQLLANVCTVYPLKCSNARRVAFFVEARAQGQWWWACFSTRDPGIQVGHYSQRTAALKQIGRTYVPPRHIGCRGLSVSVSGLKVIEVVLVPPLSI
jgi:hypothetical protein